MDEYKLIKDTLDLINRLQTDKERLQTEKDNLIKTFGECQKDVIKEFAESLKKRASRGFWETDAYVSIGQIDDVLNEMVG